MLKNKVQEMVCLTLFLSMFCKCFEKRAALKIHHPYEMVYTMYIVSLLTKLTISISRAWCKTIVTPYIKWGSYNSFAPSPRFALIECLYMLIYISFPKNITLQYWLNNFHIFILSLF